MKIQFLQAAKFVFNGNPKDEIYHYKLGTHEVPNKVIEHHYFQSLLKDSKVIDADEAAEVKPISHGERAKKLAEKVALRANLPEKKEDAAPADDGEILASEQVDEILEPVSEESEPEQESKHSKHKKSKR